MIRKQFNSYISRNYTITVVLLIAFTISVSPAIGQQELKKPKTTSQKTKWMDTIQIRDKKTGKKLRLTVYQINPLHKPLTPQQQAKELRNGRRVDGLITKSTFRRKAGNCAFVVVKSQEINKKKTLQKQVVGLAYTILFPNHVTNSPKQLSSKLVWNPRKKKGYFVLAKKRGPNLTIAIAPIDAQKKLGTFPLEFPPLKREKWLKPIKLVAELNTEASFFYMSSMDAISDKDTILIAIHGSSSESKTLYFRYDITKKQWKKVEVPEGTLMKVKSKKNESEEGKSGK